jgi:hypothetical protein
LPHKDFHAPLHHQNRPETRHDPCLQLADWYDFADIAETGSQLLTMEFLMSLGIEETPKTTKIYFRFFYEQYELTTKELSVALCFSKKCFLDPSALVKTINMIAQPGGTKFLKSLLASKNSIVSIHNPTLRLLAKWLCMVVHPHSNLCLCSLLELQLLWLKR